MVFIFSLTPEGLLHIVMHSQYITGTWDCDDVLRVKLVLCPRGKVTESKVTLKEISAVSRCRDHRGWSVAPFFFPLCLQCGFHAMFHLVTANVLRQLRQSTHICLCARTGTVILMYFPLKRIVWYRSACYLICPSFRSITWYFKINRRKRSRGETKTLLFCYFASVHFLQGKQIRKQFI